MSQPTISRTLRLVFENIEGRQTAISIWDPNPEPDAQAVEDLMDHIVTNDIFMTSGGAITGKVKAELVERSVDEVYSA